MDFLTVKLFPDNLIEAIGNTLLHSLWQGLLLAAVTGLIIVCTRKSSAAKRYNLLIAAFTLFAVAAIGTFVIELSYTGANYHVAPTHNITIKNTPVAKSNLVAIQQTPFKDKVITLFNKNANTIVLIWFLFVCARCLQLLTGLQGVYYLRRRAIFQVDKQWKNRIKQLAMKLDIKQLIEIAESGLAKVPMVIGHLKPLILIPVGLMTSLSPEEVEAILVHELAHIRRRDYLVNLLQSLMEIIFFFNPAVLWISALIKTERENCCDDIAVAQSSSKADYIRALVSCQEYNSLSPAYAMALSGNKTHLLARVKRIITNNNHSLNMMEKSLLAICLVSAGLLTAAFSNADKIDKLVTKTAKAIVHLNSAVNENLNSTKAVNKINLASKKDTATANKLKIFQSNEIGDHTSFQVSNNGYTSQIYKEKGILYQLNYKKGSLISMQVDGKTIPKNQIAAYQPIIDQIPHRSETQHAENSDNVVQSSSSSDSESKTSTLRINGSVLKLDAKQESANENRDLILADSVNKAYHKTPVPTPPGATYPRPYPIHPSYTPESMRERALKDSIANATITADLMKDGLITDPGNLVFKLTDEEFILNGKKQDDAIFQRYKRKYVPAGNSTNWTWTHSIHQ
ncbi:MAG TPA: M56 family metallopeptidase [Mucilaginibacter sp.]|jgi:beta-lactamase regulating signal transducer with metallopeptidase domain